MVAPKFLSRSLNEAIFPEYGAVAAFAKMAHWHITDTDTHIIWIEKMENLTRFTHHPPSSGTSRCGFGSSTSHY